MQMGEKRTSMMDLGAPGRLTPEFLAELEPNRSTLFVGPVGSGKTWALRAYLRQVAAQGGKVWVHTDRPYNWREEYYVDCTTAGLAKGRDIAAAAGAVVDERFRKGRGASPEEGIRPLVLALDGSLWEALRSNSPLSQEMADRLERILRLGRSVDVHLAATVYRLGQVLAMPTAMRDLFTQVVVCDNTKFTVSKY